MTEEFMEYICSMYTDKMSAMVLMNAWRGWQAATNSEDNSLIRGIGPYCAAWNYVMLKRAGE